MKTISERKRAKFTGRGGGHSFQRMPQKMLDSPQFGALSAFAVKLLLEAARKFRGSNNGNLSLAWSQVSPRGWNSAHTVAKAKRELLATGFLIQTRQGGKNHCSLFAVTWEAVDDCAGARLEVSPTKVASHLWNKSLVHPVHQLDAPSASVRKIDQPEKDDLCTQCISQPTFEGRVDARSAQLYRSTKRSGSTGGAGSLGCVGDLAQSLRLVGSNLVDHKFRRRLLPTELRTFAASRKCRQIGKDWRDAHRPDRELRRAAA